MEMGLLKKMRNVTVDLKNTVIIHAAILQHVNYFQMQLVQQALAVISKHANLNYLDQFAVVQSMSAIYQNIVPVKMSFAQMMFTRLMEHLAKWVRPSVTGEPVAHTPINVSYFGVRQEKSLIISAMNRIEKGPDMVTVVTTV